MRQLPYKEVREIGFSIKEWLIGKLSAETAATQCKELAEAGVELQIRELAFHTCVNMVANALGRCEFKTFVDHKQVQEDEHYLWNIEPNANQNSTAFLHKLVYQLFSQNEALVLEVGKSQGNGMLVVADQFQRPSIYPVKPNEYAGVQVGEISYSKTFTENEVMHLTLNHINVRPVINGMYDSYYKLISSAMKHYKWANGKHVKMKIARMSQGSKEAQKEFLDTIQEQVKPFLNSESAVLPEFDGGAYELFGGNPDAQRTTRDIRALVDDIFHFTARAFCIPPVLLLGDVAGTQDAMTRWLTTCIDPLCDQLQEEIIRKRYGLQQWKRGNYLQIDTSSILHFDMFGNAANVEKLIGSGAYSINDVRKAAGQSEIAEDWANKHFLTLNIGIMETVARAAEETGKGGERN